MEDEERTYHDAHFQEELGSLKVMVRMLEQTLRNTSGEPIQLVCHFYLESSNKSTLGKDWRTRLKTLV